MPEAQAGSMRVVLHPGARPAPLPHWRAPQSVAETGLSWSLLSDLLARHLLDEPPMTLAELSGRLALPEPVTWEIADRMAQQGLLEVEKEGGGARCDLNLQGRAYAVGALTRCGYCGPAPVLLDDYRILLAANSVREHPVRQQEMHAAFEDVVVSERVLDAFGRGLNSDRAMLVCGPVGAGKTFLAQRLVHVFDSPTLIPYAIAVGDAIVTVYDSALHEPYPRSSGEPADASDPRLALCRRPGIIVGAQLTPEMLELRFDPATRSYESPLQLKANNGVLIVDDLGRQRAPVVDLINRWSVPLETRHDWLALESGRSAAVPFDVKLILVTNLDPETLDVEVLRRRVGHTVHLGPIAPAEYEAIWRQACARAHLEYDPALARHAIECLHARDGVPLLPCHPGDLLALMLDQSRYAGGAGVLTVEMLETAWETQFPRNASDGAGEPDRPATVLRTQRRQPC